MGMGIGFRIAFNVTSVSLFCSSVWAEVTQRQVSAQGFAISGYKSMDAGACSLAGIVKDYATLAYIKEFFPKNKQAEIKEVKWKAGKPNTITIVGKKVHVMTCQSVDNAKGASLNCYFEENPLGVEQLQFKISRQKEESSCVESVVAQGKFKFNSMIAKALGVKETPEQLHHQVALAMLGPYLPSANNAARGTASTNSKNAPLKSGYMNAGAAP